MRSIGLRSRFGFRHVLAASALLCGLWMVAGCDTVSEDDPGLPEISWQLEAESASYIRFAERTAGGVWLGCEGGVACYRSADAGRTWAPLSPPHEAGGLFQKEIAAGPSGVAYLWARLDQGLEEKGLVYRSTDEGISWAVLPEQAWLNTTHIYDLAVDAEGTLYAIEGTYVYVSTDQGQSWVVRQLPSHSTQLVVRGEDVFALGGKLLLTRNWGATWQVFDTPFVPSSDPVRAGNALYIVGREDAGALGMVDGVYRSADAGITWSRTPLRPSNMEIRSLAADETGRLYAGAGYDGVFLSTDGGASWREANGGFPTSSLGTLMFSVGRLLPVRNDELIAIEAESSAGAGLLRVYNTSIAD